LLPTRLGLTWPGDKEPLLSSSYEDFEFVSSKLRYTNILAGDYFPDLPSLPVSTMELSIIPKKTGMGRGDFPKQLRNRGESRGARHGPGTLLGESLSRAVDQRYLASWFWEVGGLILVKQNRH
jgi:hypothetical protein